MDYWLDETGMPRRRDGVTIPVIGIAIALSVLLHVALLWQWKLQVHKPTPDKDITPPLTVKLAPLPGPPPAMAMRTPPPMARTPITPVAPAAPDMRAAPPRPSQGAPPPVIALPAPSVPAPAEQTTRAPPAVDFAAFIESQRRARGESATATPQPAEDENARATRQAVANLSAPKALALGHDPTRSGGVFTVKRRAVDYAEFTFNGWHSEARRNWAQDITVRKGNHPTIELAVVREMIDIIRKYEQADFPWYSYRLRRTVTRSARLRDSAELEEFLMQEFFFNPRVAP